MIVTKEMLDKASTDKNGYTKRQIAKAQDLFPGKWKSQLLGADVSLGWWTEFCELRMKPKRRKAKKTKPKIINPFSKSPDSWSWKPDKNDIPEIKAPISSKGNKNSGVMKAKRNKALRLSNDEFYKSRQWKELRVRVLEKYECKCMMCGRSPRVHGVVIHIDHIKPRSKNPELSLTFDNLQLLCDDCNLGKSNKYETDWRPDKAITDEERLDMKLLTKIN